MGKRWNVSFIMDECVITTTVEAGEGVPEDEITGEASKIVTSHLGLSAPVRELALDVVTEEG